MTENYVIAQAGLPGGSTTEYRGSKGVLCVAVITGLAIALVGVIPFLLNYDEAGPTERAISWGIGLLILGVAVLVLRKAVRDYGRRVVIGPEGLVYTVGDRGETVRWDEVEAVYQRVTKRYIHGIYLGTTRRYIVHYDGDRRLTFDGKLADVDGLGARIQHEVTSRLLPRARASYDAGASLAFGALGVSRHGLSNGRETVAWNDIQSVRLDQGMLTVRKRGKWRNWSRIPVAKTPNVWVFLALVDDTIGVAS